MPEYESASKYHNRQACSTFRPIIPYLPLLASLDKQRVVVSGAFSHVFRDSGRFVFVLCVNSDGGVFGTREAKTKAWARERHVVFDKTDLNARAKCAVSPFDVCASAMKATTTTTTTARRANTPPYFYNIQGSHITTYLTYTRNSLQTCTHIYLCRVLVVGVLEQARPVRPYPQLPLHHLHELLLPNVRLRPLRSGPQGRRQVLVGRFKYAKGEGEGGGGLAIYREKYGKAFSGRKRGRKRGEKQKQGSTNIRSSRLSLLGRVGVLTSEEG